MGLEVRVFGPPGTGKTTFLASQVRSAVEKHGSDSVIVTSFTRAAAAEIAGRDLPIEPAQVGTLHAHCYRALSRPVIAETKLKEWNQEYPALALGGEGGNLDEPASERKYETPGDEMMARLQVLRARMVDRDLWPEQVASFAARWDEWKEAHDYIDFTGMIERALTDLDRAPGDPRIGFLDEVQDCTRLQLTLWRKWARHMDFNVIAGDDDQAIYSWLGATPDAFLDPPIPDNQKRILRQSYRVPRTVQALASRWIGQVSRREPKEYAPRDVDGEVTRIAASWRYVEPLLEDATRQTEQGRTCMVLASCSYMLVPLLAVLRQEGIPYCNPYRRTRGDWNPLGGGRGTSATGRLLAFLAASVEHHGANAREWTADEFRTWAEVLEAKGVFKYGRKTIIEAMKGRNLLAIEDWWGHFASDEVAASALDTDLDWYQEHLMAARRKGFEFPMQVLRKHGIKALSEKPKLIAGTIHSVKGGEAECVYLIPDLSLAGMQEWATPGEGRDGVTRMMYVGMTRARERLVLCQPATPFNVGRIE